MPDIRTILDPLPLDNGVKAEVWDQFQAVTDQEDFQHRFNGLKLPDEVKAQLWDAKFGQPTAAPSPVSAPAPPAQSAASPGLLERLGNVVRTGARNLQGTLVESLVRNTPFMPQPDQPRKGPAPADQPLLPISELIPPQPGDNGFVNFTRGAAQVAEGMTSPKSLALIGALGGATKVLNAATSSYGKAGARMLDVGIDAYFATQAGEGLLESAPQIRRAYEEKNYPALFTLLGQDVVQGVFGTYFGVRGAKKGLELSKTARSAYDYVKGQRIAATKAPREPGYTPPAGATIVEAGAPGATPPRPAGGQPAAEPARPTPQPGGAVATISQKQSAALWARKAELGLADEPFRAIIQRVSGQDSTKALTGPQASQVIDALNKVQPPGAKPAGEESGLVQLAKQFIAGRNRTNITALERELKIPRDDARKLMQRLVRENVLDRLGRPIQLQTDMFPAGQPQEPIILGQGAPPAGATPPAGPPASPELSEEQPAASQAPQPTLLDRAREIGAAHGRITRQGLKNYLGIGPRQADALLVQLSQAGDINPNNGAYLKFQKPEKPEAKPAVSPPAPPLPSGETPPTPPVPPAPVAPPAPVTPAAPVPAAPAPAATAPAETSPPMPMKVAELPAYAQGAIHDDSMMRRTNEGGSLAAPDPYKDVQWEKSTVPIESLKPGNEMLWDPNSSFRARGSMTKGPIVQNDRGEIIDGNNRLYEAIQRGDRSIDVFRPQKPLAASAEPPVSSEAAAPDLKAQADEISKPGWSPEPGAIYRNFPVSKIGIDAPRFQYKGGTGAEGVNETLKGLKRFNQEQAGPVHLWHEPETGTDWLINGHQRTGLAKRTGQPGIDVHFIAAKDASEARLKGALINIGENNGTSIDAAKLFRETGMGPDEVAAVDIQLSGPIAREGLALSNLAQPLFDKVVSGELPAQRAAVIGSGVKEHADQVALYDRVRQLEKSGKRPTNEQLGEMIRLKPPVKKTKEKLLWGDEEVVQSLIPEKAEVSTYVRNELGSERRLFGTVAKSDAAERLSKRGNVLKGEENLQAAEEANQGLAIYDKLSASAGPINDVLDRAAGELAQGGNSHAVKQRAYEEIRSYLVHESQVLSGKSPRAAERAAGLRGEGNNQAAPGQQSAAPAEGQLADAAGKAREQLGDLFNDESGTFDPAALRNAATVGAHKITSGFTKYSAWSKEMLRELGAGIKPHLMRIWAAARNLLVRYRRSKLGSERGSFLFDEGETAGNREVAKSDAAKLEAERLTAEFKSPLNRNNLRKKLKPGERPVQTGLFEEAPPPPAQAKLFGSERGSVSPRPQAPDPYRSTYTPRLKNTVWGGIADILRPGGSLVERQGEAGKALKYFIDEAFDAGDNEAGKRLERLDDSGITKLKNRDDRFGLVDVLEGRRTGTPELQQLAGLVKGILDDTGRLAEDLGLEISAGGRKIPFVALPNYFPHVIRSVEQLGKGQIRRDVLDNLVRLGVQPDLDSARTMLDEYRAWVDTGGPHDQLVRYLIDSGQAGTRGDATAMLDRMRKDRTLRNGSLEFAREADLPFWDPDPARVLPHWVATASERLERIRVFGQNEQEFVDRMVEQIRESGGDVATVKDAVGRILGTIEGLPKWKQVSAFFRTIQGFKLGLAAIPNATQGALNSLLYGDLQAVGAGFKGILTKEGRRFGMRSGAAIDSVLNEMTREVGSEWHPLGVYLKAVGFTGTERLNRIFAANAGANYAGRLARRLRLNPQSKSLRSAIEELGIDPDQVRSGQLTGDQILRAAKKFSDITQFRSRPQDLPIWASSPAGKVFFQFKTFVYSQARLVLKTTRGEFGRGNYGKAARNLLILAVVFPMAGEAIGAFRRLLTGREREKDQTILQRWADAQGQAGALGMLSDPLESVQYGGGLLKYAAGPAPGEIADIGDAALRILTAKDPWKAAGNFGKTLLKHAPLVSQLRRRLLPGLFPPQKKPAAPLDPEVRRLLRESGIPE